MKVAALVLCMISSVGPALAQSAPPPSVKPDLEQPSQRAGRHFSPATTFHPDAPLQSAAPARSETEEQMSRMPGHWIGTVPGGRLDDKTLPVPDADLLAVPVFDVDKNCSVNLIPNTKNYCIDEEQGDYDFIRRVWDRVSLPSRNVCVSIGRREAAAAILNRNPWVYGQIKACIQARLEIEDQLRLKSSQP